MAIVSLYTADLHLTDKPRDDYRWNFLSWLESFLAEKQVRYLFILGDLLDDKDNHASSLVNKFIRHLKRLLKVLDDNTGGAGKIFLLAGNHDSTDQTQPYFTFLHRSLNGRIFFFTRPAEIGLWQQRYLFLPYSKTFDEYVQKYDFSKYDRVLIHQPVCTGEGIEYANGVDVAVLGTCGGSVLAGDIHTRNQVGKYISVGAPFPVNMNDLYVPRVLIDVDGELTSFDVPSIRKVKLNVTSVADFVAKATIAFDRPEELKAEGDCAKVEVMLPRSEFGSWKEISKQVQAEAETMGIKATSLSVVEKKSRPILVRRTEETAKTKTPLSTLIDYAKVYNVDDGLMEYGRKLVK